MNIATLGFQKLNPSIICCELYIYVKNSIFMNFSRIRARVPSSSKYEIQYEFHE